MAGAKSRGGAGPRPLPTGSGLVASARTAGDAPGGASSPVGNPNPPRDALRAVDHQTRASRGHTSGSAELVSRATAPLNPLRVVQARIGVGDAGAFEEHHQVVVAVGGAEDLVMAVAVHGDSPAARRGGPVHDDRRAAHASQLAPGPGGWASRSGRVRGCRLSSPSGPGRRCVGPTRPGAPSPPNCNSGGPTPPYATAPARSARRAGYGRRTPPASPAGQARRTAHGKALIDLGEIDEARSWQVGVLAPAARQPPADERAVGDHSHAVPCGGGQGVGLEAAQDGVRRLLAHEPLQVPVVDGSAGSAPRSRSRSASAPEWDNGTPPRRRRATRRCRARPHPRRRRPHGPGLGEP